MREASQERRRGEIGSDRQILIAVLYAILQIRTPLDIFKPIPRSEKRWNKEPHRTISTDITNPLLDV